MAKADIWPIIHAERKALASDLESLSPDQWSAPSLCTRWTIHEVLAHMVATARMTPGKFFPKLISSGLRFEAVQAKGVAEEKGTGPADTLARFKEVLGATSKPPGPAETALGETLVHEEDIRRPLGIPHSYPVDSLVAVADFYRTSNLILGGKRRVAGLTLKTTDADWSAGSGPEVEGPALAIVLAVAGRKSALDDLSGPGTETLASRM